MQEEDGQGKAVVIGIVSTVCLVLVLSLGMLYRFRINIYKAMNIENDLEKQALLDYEAKQRELAAKPTRAFVFVYNQTLGFLVLKAFKRKKGVHYQLPGGKIDDSDGGNGLSASAAAASRELFEETGLIVKPSELKLLKFAKGLDHLERRQYFFYEIDENNYQVAKAKIYAVSESNKETNKQEIIKIKLSKEHIGYDWVVSRVHASHMLAKHSAGASAYAMKHIVFPSGIAD
jgi:8-oxo-dGTP pyrophosphatase MutT (NUDIX family)